jgi:translation initiation factor IF-3
MRGSQCLFNPATALRRVFINSALSQEARGGQPALQRVCLASVKPARQSRCSVAFHPTLHGRESSTLSDKTLAKLSDRLRDREIADKYGYILVRDETTGRLSEPRRPQDVLRELNLLDQSLVVLMDPSQMKNPAGRLPEYPICCIVDRRAERAARGEKVVKDRAAGAAGASKDSKFKEIELNWAIAINDLNVRLRQLRTFLNKGYFVQVTLLKKSKKGQSRKIVDLEQAKKLLQMVQQTIEEIPGTKEVKPMQGHVGRMIKIRLKGTKVAPKSQDSAPEQGEAEAILEEETGVKAEG